MSSGLKVCPHCSSELDKSARSSDPWVGKTLAGKFLIEKKLGSGAMGTIYQADQISLNKTVAIKVLHSRLRADPELIGRFKREAKAASRLNHANCVQILDFGETEEGGLYIAMQYVQGIDLATLLEREYPLAPLRIIAIMKQVCLALDEAHAKGVLHRDLKPENIMIENLRQVREHVKVVDFGIAKIEDNDPNSRRSFQTLAGLVCGTPEYMSPEQARGRRLDARSDLYALGVMLYHLLTDKLPFEAPSPIEVVTKHIGEIPVEPRIHRPDIAPALNTLIMRLLEKDRDARPASAMALHDDLEAIERQLTRELAANPRHSEAETTLDLRHQAAMALKREVKPAEGGPATQVMASVLADASAEELSDASLKMEPADTVPDGGPPGMMSRDVAGKMKEQRAEKNDLAKLPAALGNFNAVEERKKDTRRVVVFAAVAVAALALCTGIAIWVL